MRAASARPPREIEIVTRRDATPTIPPRRMVLDTGVDRQTGQVMVRWSIALVLAAASMSACSGGSDSTALPDRTAEAGRTSARSGSGGDGARPSAATPKSPATPPESPPPDGPKGANRKEPDEEPKSDSMGDLRPLGWGPTQGEWKAAQAAVSDMPVEELAGQVIVARYTGTEPPLQLVEQFHLGGVIVMGDNYASLDATVKSNQLLQSSDDRPWPLVIGVDQEGGSVTRIGAPMTQFPTYMSLGAAIDLRLARAAASANGEELRAAGFTMVFAPVADVTLGASDPTIGSRSAGDDAREVAAVVRASTLGYVDSGIVSVVKHFPGHGSVTVDSHLALPHQGATVSELNRRDFLPFAASVEAGAPAVMMAHISVDRVAPGVPADLAPEVVGLLREDLGFDGLVVTDALEMEAVVSTYGAGPAAVAALQADSDLLLMPADVEAAHSAIVSAVSSGSLPRARLEEAAAKVVALMMHEEVADPVDARVIGSHHEISRQVSAKALTVVAGKCKGPYVEGSVLATGEGEAVQAFNAAAEEHGLAVGSGTTVALIGAYGGPSSADVVVSLDTPYVLAGSSASKAKLAVYGSTPQAMEALVDVLVGEAVASGRLPVAVPGVPPPAC